MPFYKTYDIHHIIKKNNVATHAQKIIFNYVITYITDTNPPIKNIYTLPITNIYVNISVTLSGVKFNIFFKLGKCKKTALFSQNLFYPAIFHAQLKYMYTF